MKKALISTLMHVIAVAASIAVAIAAWKLIGSDSEIILIALTAASLTIEKLVRSLPMIPIGDYVNDR